MQTQFIVLENGNLQHLVSGEIVREISGQLLTIVEGERDKCCFVFRDEEQELLTRLYLDTDKRPASRLLILLAEKADRLSTMDVTVWSEQGSHPHDSRLRLSMDGQQAYAPHHLFADRHDDNQRYLKIIRYALGYMEAPQQEEVGENDNGSQAEEISSTANSTLADLRGHMPVVLDGLNGDFNSVSERDARRMTLVMSFPLAIATVPDGVTNIKLNDVYNEDLNLFFVKFVTEEERNAFIKGFKAAAGNKTVLVEKDMEQTKDILRFYRQPFKTAYWENHKITVL